MGLSCQSTILANYFALTLGPKLAIDAVVLYMGAAMQRWNGVAECTKQPLEGYHQ